MSRENLRKLGELAGKQKGKGKLTVTLPKQADVSYMWKGAALHPMQALQNIHHRTVREALRGIEGDDERRDEVSKQLGGFFYFDASAPQLLPPLEKGVPDRHFLDERIAGCSKQLQTLSRVLRKLPTADDTQELGDTAKAKLSEQLKELRSIAWAVPNHPVIVTEPMAELDEIQEDLESADGESTGTLAAVAERLTNVAGTIESILLGHCCLANFHVIDTFYLFRLLVKYRFQSEEEIDSDLKSDVSGAVTGFLHNGPNQATKWITDWLTEKLVELNIELMKIDKENLFFYLKGGRALEYLLDSPWDGQNDFDTGIIINPELPPAKWYELFAKVYNLCIRHLRQCKYEFIGLLEENQEAFDEYVDGLLNPKPAEGAEAAVDLVDESDGHAERAAKRVADLLMQLDPPDERASGKAELIDIGMPRRDTPEVWETWHLKAGKRETKGMVYPGPLYYIGEYVMMIRDALQPGSRAAKKSNKRVVRLSKLLHTNKTDAAVAHEIEEMPADLLPDSVAAAAGFGNDGKAIKTFLVQMAYAHLLREDAGFRDKLDPYIAAKCGERDTYVVLPEEFSNAISTLDARQIATAKACGFMDRIAGEVEKHLRDRGRFFKAKRKEFSRFVKAIYTASIFNNQAEDLELMFCVAGSFAARLHAEYANYEHVDLGYVTSRTDSAGPDDGAEDIEPLHRVDLKVYCRKGVSRTTVLDVLTPGIIEAYKSHPETPQYIVQESSNQAVNMYWPSEEKMGEFTYRPLVIRLTLEERPESDWPQLAFIWGYPVLGLRDLVWDYIRECGHTEEVAARKRLRKTADALTDILSKFENPGAKPAAAVQPAPQLGADPPPQFQPPRTWTPLEEGTAHYLTVEATAGAVGNGGGYPGTIPPDKQHKFTVTSALGLKRQATLRRGRQNRALDLMVLTGGHGDVGNLFGMNAAEWKTNFVEPLIQSGVKTKILVLDACLTASMVGTFSPLLTGDGKMVANVYTLNSVVMDSDMWGRIYGQLDGSHVGEVWTALETRMGALASGNTGQVWEQRVDAMTDTEVGDLARDHGAAHDVVSGVKNFRQIRTVLEPIPDAPDVLPALLGDIYNDLDRIRAKPQLHGNERTVLAHLGASPAGFGVPQFMALRTAFRDRLIDMLQRAGYGVQLPGVLTALPLFGVDSVTSRFVANRKTLLAKSALPKCPTSYGVFSQGALTVDAALRSNPLSNTTCALLELLDAQAGRDVPQVLEAVGDVVNGQVNFLQP